MLHRAQKLAFWTAPALLGLVLYWPGLMSWFQKDDFAWLGLRDLVGHGHDLRLGSVCAPRRRHHPHYQRARVLPIVHFSLWLRSIAVSPVDLPLLCSHDRCVDLSDCETDRLAGSRILGSRSLGTLNSVLAVPLSWSPIYYEILCSLVFSGQSRLLIRYGETGRPLFYWLQCGTFLLGFGVLELDVGVSCSGARLRFMSCAAAYQE